MAILQALRHHIRRAHVKVGVRNDWSPDCTAEMQAEDEALERRLKAVEALKYPIERRLAAVEALNYKIERLERRVELLQSLEARVSMLEGRIDAVALAVELNRQGTADMFAALEGPEGLHGRDRR